MIEEQSGKCIGVVAPASGFDSAALERGIARLQQMGHRVKRGAHLASREPQYFAGMAEQRADDLHAMFADKEVDVIACARGGYGCQALLPLLDSELIHRNPKPLLGCSDITALQLWLMDRCGVRALHGPMVAGDFAREDGVHLESFTASISGKQGWKLGEPQGLQVLKQGKAQGRLWGGCLSLLVSSLATPYELLQRNDADSILFFEDIGEKPYKIERMLRQWRDAGKMERVRGIVIGEMFECEQPGAAYKLRDVLERVLADFSGPVAMGLRSGHVSRNNVTLPLGVQAELQCGAQAELKFPEAATSVQ